MIENFVLSCKGIARHFNEASGVLKVLTDVNLQISLGEKIAIVGSSGSGKTTLLHILGGLDQPTYCEIFLNGESSERKAITCGAHLKALSWDPYFSLYK